MRPRCWCSLLATALLLVACGGGVDDGERDDAGQVEVTWSDEASATVVAVDSGGGLPPPERVPERFAAVPAFVLYGDGTAYWETEDGFRTIRLDQPGVATVLGWAADAGLLDPGGVDTGEPEVYDVGSVWYDLTVDGTTRHTQVAAPGFEDEDVGLSDDEIAARARIEAFSARLFSLSAELPDERIVAPEAPPEGVAWEVLIRPRRSDGTSLGTAPPWTLGDPAIVGRCRVVTGAQARRVADEVGATGDAQIWAVDGEPWVVVARPLLPGAAPPCPGGA